MLTFEGFPGSIFVVAASGQKRATLRERCSNKIVL
jgi:hypothetical protein